MITTILTVSIIIYLALSVIVYFLANSNIIPARRNKEYSIGFGAEMKKFQSKLTPEKYLAYWVAENDNPGKNAIFLHGFTRTSDKLQKRAEIYWNLGYTLYFVDNLGHGYSSDLLYPSGYRYSREVKDLIRELNIKNPIIHGLSMGAIAANVIAQLEPEIPTAIVCEALPRHFDNLYPELMNYLGLPGWLFPWLEFISRKLNWKQFEELGLDEEDYEPMNIEKPIFLIHSQSDKMFDYREHFIPMQEKFDQREKCKTWLVPEAGHTRMDSHPEYDSKLRDFLVSVEN